MKRNLNGMIIGLYLSIPMLARIVSSVITINNNIVIMIIALVIGSICINWKKIKINKVYILINIFIILFFIFSIIRIDNKENLINYLFSYLAYGTVGMFFVQQNHKKIKVFTTINLVFIIYTMVLLINYIPDFLIGKNLLYTMDVSYASLIGIVSVILTNKNIKKLKLKNKKNTKYFYLAKSLYIIALIFNISYLLTLNNNRGTVIIFFIFLFMMGIKKIKDIKKRILITSILCLLVLILFNPIINIISKYNTNINWIQKLAIQLKEGDITSNRIGFYNKAIEGILNHPIIGNGIGKFENENNKQYTHNIFLQLLYEFGIPIGTVISIIITIISFKVIFKSRKTIKDDFLMLMWLESIPRLMISSVYWVNSFFWIFMYYGIIEGRYIKNRRKNKICLKTCLKK